MEIVDQSEDLGKREIHAEISPLEVKKEIVSRVRLSQKQSYNFQSGLADNNYYKVLKVSSRKGKARWTREYIFGNDFNRDATCKDKVIEFRILCKQRMYSHFHSHFIVTYLDEDQIPLRSIKGRISCSKNDIIASSFCLPPHVLTLLSPDIKTLADAEKHVSVWPNAIIVSRLGDM